MASLRERLRARQLPTAEVPLAADPVAYAAARRELESATQAHAVAQLRGDDLAPFQDRVAAAQAALDAQPVETFVLRCIPPSEWEALIQLHPPPDDQRDRWDYNLPTFRPALLAASVVVPDDEVGLTEGDWVELANGGHLAVGELDLLFGTAVQLNARTPQVSTGKG